jgi:hypothetical protein
MRAKAGATRSPRTAAVIAWAAASLLLLSSSALRLADVAIDRLPAPRRYWEDLTVATSQLAPALPDREARDIGAAQARRHALQRSLEASVELEAIRPWEFWRTVRVRPMLRSTVLEGRGSDDTGRALLLVLGFRLLGGVAPMLPLWVGALAFLPVLLWLCLELGRVGRPVAATWFALSCAATPYLLEALSLPYSAVGFYLTALVGLAALGSYVHLGQPRPWGLLLRTALAGALFALCVLCRSSTFLMAPAYALTVAWGAARVGSALAPQRSALRALGAFALLAALFAPYLAVRPPQQHEVWLGIWEGLGDFDRARGHAWSDRVTREVLRAEGSAPARHAPVWQHALKNEPIFRRRFLQGVRSDPAWYAGILVKRLLATVTLWKLWPWAPTDGASFRPATTVNEGAMDTYYRLTTTAEWVGFGRWRAELPILALIAPTAALAWLWRPSATPRVPRATGLLVGLAVAALALPVAVTTASGIETEAFVLVYSMGSALLAQELWARLARGRAPGPEPR